MKWPFTESDSSRFVIAVECPAIEVIKFEISSKN